MGHHRLPRAANSRAQARASPGQVDAPAERVLPVRALPVGARSFGDYRPPRLRAAIFLAPYFLRPMEAASASGSRTPFRESFLESDLNRAPLPSLGLAMREG